MEEFLEKIKSLKIHIYDENDKIKRKFNENHFIIKLSHLSSVVGGSCWSEDYHETVSGNDNFEFNDLDNLLIQLFPKITLIQYLELKSIIKTDDYTVREYYGNSASYHKQYIKISDLYNKLKELGCL